MGSDSDGLALAHGDEEDENEYEYEMDDDDDNEVIQAGDEEPMSPNGMANKVTIGAMDDDGLDDEDDDDDLIYEEPDKHGYVASPQVSSGNDLADAEYEYYDDDEDYEEDEDNMETMQ